MTPVGDGDGPESRYCGARKRQGEGHCHRPAGWGTNHLGIGRCKLHGGSTPDHVKHANGQKAANAVVTFGLPRDIDPQDALLEEVHRTAGHVAYLGAIIAAFEDEASLKQLDTSERWEKPAVWVELYQAERTHLMRVAKVCLDAGIAERQVRLAEAQGLMFVELLRKILTDTFARLADAGLALDVLARIQRDDVPVVIRRHLSELVAATE